MTVLLETERMVLRHFTPDDLDELIELDNDPQVMRFINGGAPTPTADVQHFLDHWIGYDERGTGYGTFAAIDKSINGFLGWFHLRPGEGAGLDEPELGYRLVSRAWGRGLGTEGAVALVDLAFRSLGAARVYAGTMVVNTASRRVMEKAGLRLVRIFHATWPVRIPGDEQGDVEYAITGAEWAAATAASES